MDIIVKLITIQVFEAMKTQTCLYPKTEKVNGSWLWGIGPTLFKNGLSRWYILSMG